MYGIVLFHLQLTLFFSQLHRSINPIHYFHLSYSQISAVRAIYTMLGRVLTLQLNQYYDTNYTGITEFHYQDKPLRNDPGYRLSLLNMFYNNFYKLSYISFF